MKTTRQLTIQEAGPDAPVGAARLRLAGKWLRDYGFHPGQTVTVTAVSPGVIELRICSPVRLRAKDFTLMRQLDAACQRYDQLRKSV